MSRYRILVVEPDPELQGVLREYLANSSFDVLCAGTGSDAIDVVRRERPDLVLCEQQMASMDGLSLARGLKQEPDLCTTPVVLIARGPRPEDRLACLDAGADDYLLRPFSMKELGQRCRNQIEFRHQREPGELSGDLSRFKATDILQLLEANQSTGVLHIRGNETSGEIHLLDGYICGGFVGERQGEQAVYSLVPLRRGRFHFIRSNIRSNIQTLRSTTEFMMEALRRHDENERQPTPADPSPSTSKA